MAPHSIVVVVSGLLLVGVAATVIGMLLPRVHVREIVVQIEASPAQVWERLSNLYSWLASIAPPSHRVSVLVAQPPHAFVVEHDGRSHVELARYSLADRDGACELRIVKEVRSKNPIARLVTFLRGRTSSDLLENEVALLRSEDTATLWPTVRVRGAG